MTRHQSCCSKDPGRFRFLGAIAVATLLFIVWLSSSTPRAYASVPACGPLVSGVHQVSTPEQLAAVARGADDAGECGRRASYLQTQPIRLSGSWTPIPSSFRGTFDGGGHAINGLVVNWPGNYAGMFNFLATGAAVRNVHLVDATISVTLTSLTFAGALAGAVDPLATITNSSTSGSVSGGSFAGGLVGYNGGRISASYSSVAVSGVNTVGALVGSNDGEIVNSYATGDIAGSNRVGGLVGHNSLGSIEASYSKGTVSGISDVGGLVGTSDSTVLQSFYDSETSGRSDSGKGVAKLTTELKDIATYTTANWDIVQGWNPFDSTGTPKRIWGICPQFNNGYPFLLWQTSSDPCGSAAVAAASSAVSPAVHLDLKAKVGTSVAGTQVLAEGEGLKPGSPYSLIVRSTPVNLTSGTVSQGGRFSHTLSMPTGISSGVHTITLTATGSGGQHLTLSQAFTVGPSGEFVALGPVLSQTARGLAVTGSNFSLGAGIGSVASILLLGGLTLALARKRLIAGERS